MKNAPKSITSEMMKSSIPSSWGSTREERLAVGRPVVLVAVAATEAASIRRSPSARRRSASTTTCSTGVAVDAAHALDQVGAQPARAGLREGGDHDLVDARRTGARSWIAVNGSGSPTCPIAVEALVVEALEHVREALARLGRASPVAAALAGRSR